MVNMTSDRIAEQVRRWRERRALTRDQLAERCDELGEPTLTAEVILNIEGRKLRGAYRYRDVSARELMVLARALEVAPLAILFPVGEVETVDVPGNDQTHTWEAARWFSGEKPFAGFNTGHARQIAWAIPHGEGKVQNDAEAMAGYKNASGQMAVLRQADIELRQGLAIYGASIDLLDLIDTAETPAVRDAFRSAAKIMLAASQKHNDKHVTLLESIGADPDWFSEVHQSIYKWIRNRTGRDESRQIADEGKPKSKLALSLPERLRARLEAEADDILVEP